MSDLPTRDQTTVDHIKTEWSKHQATPKNVLAEVNRLRTEDTSPGHLNKTLFGKDLSAVNNQLHKDGILPHLDIFEDGQGHAAFQGISSPGANPGDGKPSEITEAHGTKFTYDSHGHVESWTKGDDSWKYNSKDGEYHEYVDGKANGRTSSDIVSMNGNGTEKITHPDGSTTSILKWGAKIDRNADGEMTSEENGDTDRTFHYNKDGTLMSMTDRQGKSVVTYTRAGGKYYASNDPDHKNPLDITVEPKNPDGSGREDGVVQIADKDGDKTDYHLSGTDVHYDKNNHLTEIDYANGNKATDFQYGASGSLKGFTMADHDKAEKYTDDQWGFKVGPEGELTATQNGNGDQQVMFGIGGGRVYLHKFGNQYDPEQIVSPGGQVSKFEYDSDGKLIAINAHGYKLSLKGNQWVVDGDRDPAHLTPLVNSNGTLTLTGTDGTYYSWDAGGTETEGAPEAWTPDLDINRARLTDN